MEDALALDFVLSKFTGVEVLILVVMEDALAPTGIQVKQSEKT